MSIRKNASGLLVQGLFESLSSAARLHPRLRQGMRKVNVQSNVPYLDTGDPIHTLDIYSPKDHTGPLPVVLYVHGGGFRILSKDTHWALALRFALQGYLVFNINYRLAPKHPFPAAVQDACAAYTWVMNNAARYSGDLDRLVLAGESAGGNLVTGLTLAACTQRPEPYAQPVRQTGVTPKAVVAACGLLQASDTGRFARRRKIPALIQSRLSHVGDAYMGSNDQPHKGLADPLVELENGVEPLSPLPPFFAPVGTADPILDDTRRLKAALTKMGVECDARYYMDEVHAFHAFMWRPNARQCWDDTFAFLNRFV